MSLIHFLHLSLSSLHVASLPLFFNLRSPLRDLGGIFEGSLSPFLHARYKEMGWEELSLCFGFRFRRRLSDVELSSN
jgi:hypothetical protein